MPLISKSMLTSETAINIAIGCIMNSQLSLGMKKDVVAALRATLEKAQAKGG